MLKITIALIIGYILYDDRMLAAEDMCRCDFSRQGRECKTCTRRAESVSGVKGEIVESYWIVRKNEIVVAALAERFYDDVQLVESLKELAETGPIERVITSERVVLGESLCA